MPKPSRDDTAAIVAFLPAMEARDHEFGHFGPMVRNEKDYGIWPGFYKPEVTDQWLQALYDHHFIDPEFNASRWTPEAERYMADLQLAAKARCATIRRLLHYHVRCDRFVDGHLLSVWQSGHLLAVMCRLAALHAAGVTR